MGDRVARLTLPAVNLARPVGNRQGMTAVPRGLPGALSSAALPPVMTSPMMSSPMMTSPVAAAPDRTALAGFALVLGAASLVTLVAYRRPVWRRPVQPGQELVEWALLGRRAGAVRTWFLLGGSIFTAYTFVAVPALVYGVGGLGFFAVPYVVIVFQLGYLVLPWLWRHARTHGWLTPADAVRARFDSPTLALAVAVTGLLATMPYVALQLLGLSASLTVMGLPPGSAAADLARPPPSPCSR